MEKCGNDCCGVTILRTSAAERSREVLDDRPGFAISDSGRLADPLFSMAAAEGLNPALIESNAYKSQSERLRRVQIEIMLGGLGGSIKKMPGDIQAPTIENWAVPAIRDRIPNIRRVSNAG